MLPTKMNIRVYQYLCLKIFRINELAEWNCEMNGLYTKSKSDWANRWELTKNIDVRNNSYLFRPRTTIFSVVWELWELKCACINKCDIGHWRENNLKRVRRMRCICLWLSDHRQLLCAWLQRTNGNIECTAQWLILNYGPALNTSNYYYLFMNVRRARLRFFCFRVMFTSNENDEWMKIWRGFRL